MGINLQEYFRVLNITVREILISFSVCLSCLMIAVISQIISPTPTNALQIDQPIQADVRQSTKTSESVTNPFELDPEDPNPSLFTMASEKTSASTVSYTHLTLPTKA